jgi:hypothetical protein
LAGAFAEARHSKEKPMPSGLALNGALLAFVAAAALAMGGCLSATNGKNAYGAGGSGFSTGGTGGNTYMPPTCGQTCQDFLVSYGVNDTIWFAWGQNLTGKPTGAQDSYANCPLGGTVHITGTTSVSNGIDSADLTFDFSDCANSNTDYSLTFNGAVTMQGSFEATTQFAALTFSSAALTTSGGIKYLDNPQIGEACDLGCAQQGTGDAWQLSGQLCGRTFDSRTALDTGTSTGSGGTTSTGGSSSACSCFCPDGSDCTGATQPNPCGVDSNGIPEACGCPVGC